MPIELRYRTYFAYLDVPKDVRKRLKRRIYRQTLQTDSKSIAERRAAPLIAQWKSEIAYKRDEPNHDDSMFWRNALKKAKTPEERQIIESNLEHHILDQGYDNTDTEAQQFYSEAFGTIISTSEHIEEWLTSTQVKDKTTKMRRSTLNRLAKKFPKLSDISRKEVRRWVTELLEELKSATVQRMMSDCRTYWAYLETIEIVPEESAPFDRLGLKVKKSPRLPYTTKEAKQILQAAKNDKQLVDLIQMAMYTGARIEELCCVKIEHIHKDRFDIVDAKSTAGIRTVPIHPKLTSVFKRLIKGSNDKYLLSGLKANSNGDRSTALGKRYGRLKHTLGFTDRHTFHSWRGTVITMLEHAGVPESTVQDIVGHERSTLTGSTYSGKSTFEMRRDALITLKY